MPVFAYVPICVVRGLHQTPQKGLQGLHTTHSKRRLQGLQEFHAANQKGDMDVDRELYVTL